MPTPFRDFIPEGEDTGAQGSGFRDFVPAEKPVKHEEIVPEEVKVEIPEIEPVKPVVKKGKVK